MPMTPADQNVEHPYSRPIQSSRTLLVGRPQPLDGLAVEANSRCQLRVTHGVVHVTPQRLADPAVERQHEALLRPLEQCGVETVKPDTVALEGTLSAIEIGPCQHTTGRSMVGTHLIVTSADQKKLNVHLGPTQSTKISLLNVASYVI